jgi:hypothetical protein
MNFATSVGCIDVMMLKLFWLGVIEAKRQKLSPRFFEVDLTLSILRILCRPEGACCGASELSEGS